LYGQKKWENLENLAAFKINDVSHPATKFADQVICAGAIFVPDRHYQTRVAIAHKVVI
jgi:hypothetical protein